MYIPESISISAAGSVYGRSAYKKNASAKVMRADSARSVENTDKLEFSAGSPSAARILPERYKESSMVGKIYYQGKNITQYELLETAVRTGAITLDETQTTGYNEEKAMNALIYSKASPAFSWSNTLYSEDRMYVFRVEHGEVTGMRKAWFYDGTTFLDVAKDLASGVRPCDIDPCKLSEFSSGDPELFKVACSIGSAKRSYIQETEEYMNGHLTKEQYVNEMDPLFLLFFGKNGDALNADQHNILKHFFDREDFALTALENYSPQDQRLSELLMSSRLNTL